jgi:bifunctional non-homologous end joining protein LigD
LTFDLLYLDGVRITPLTLTERKAQLADLVAATDTEHIQFSGAFLDPIKLLATCEKMGLEGIVSKRRDSAYRSGPTRDWLNARLSLGRRRTAIASICSESARGVFKCWRGKHL